MNFWDSGNDFGVAVEAGSSLGTGTGGGVNFSPDAFTGAYSQGPTTPGGFGNMMQENIAGQNTDQTRGQTGFEKLLEKLVPEKKEKKWYEHLPSILSGAADLAGAITGNRSGSRFAGQAIGSFKDDSADTNRNLIQGLAMLEYLNKNDSGDVDVSSGDEVGAKIKSRAMQDRSNLVNGIGERLNVNLTEGFGIPFRSGI